MASFVENINVLAGINADITTVTDNIEIIETTAGIAGDITVLSSNMATISSAVTNIPLFETVLPNVNLAISSASAAAASATAASGSATTATTKASESHTYSIQSLQAAQAAQASKESIQNLQVAMIPLPAGADASVLYQSNLNKITFSIPVGVDITGIDLVELAGDEVAARITAANLNYSGMATTNINNRITAENIQYTSIAAQLISDLVDGIDINEAIEQNIGEIVSININGNNLLISEFVSALEDKVDTELVRITDFADTAKDEIDAFVDVVDAKLVQANSLVSAFDAGGYIERLHINFVLAQFTLAQSQNQLADSHIIKMNAAADALAVAIARAEVEDARDAVEAVGAQAETLLAAMQGSVAQHEFITLLGVRR